jgi:hypothetical protein
MESRSFRTKFFWGVENGPAFLDSLGGLMAAARVKKGWFASDNLIAFGRNLGFLNDERLIQSWNKHAKAQHEIGILWRTATLVWALKQALRSEGDIVECGCYAGTTAHILMDTVDVSDRRVFLYDLFEHDASMAHNSMPELGPGLFEKVTARFADRPNVQVIRGFVPESFSQGVPDKVAFAHIDMNNAPAEIGALDALESRFVPGAMILLDDFGALPYRPQHIAETEWFAKRGISVLELPTSQGLAIW